MNRSDRQPSYFEEAEAGLTAFRDGRYEDAIQIFVQVSAVRESWYKTLEPIMPLDPQCLHAQERMSSFRPFRFPRTTRVLAPPDVSPDEDKRQGYVRQRWRIAHQLIDLDWSLGPLTCEHRLWVDRLLNPGRIDGQPFDPRTRLPLQLWTLIVILTIES